MSWEPYPDQPGGKPYYHFIEIEMTPNVRLHSLEVYRRMFECIIEAALDNPGYVPFVRIEDRRDGS